MKREPRAVLIDTKPPGIKKTWWGIFWLDVLGVGIIAMIFIVIFLIIALCALKLSLYVNR